MGLAVLAGLSACRQINPEWLGPRGESAGTDTTTLDGSDTSAPNGGTEATESDSSSAQCRPEPVAGEGECPEACSACAGGRCVIECGDHDCEDETVECPDDWPCDFSCLGDSACEGAELECAPDRDCTVECRGKDACNDTNITCGEGTCAVTCGTETNVCRSIDLYWGPADSTITCESSENVEVHENDDDSCTCETIDCDD